MGYTTSYVSMDRGKAQIVPESDKTVSDLNIPHQF